METVTIGYTRLVLKEGDITLEDTDAIVNAANPSLMGGGGVDGAIHRAGGPKILEECRRIRQQQGDLPPGDAVITSGGNLKARHVIHTVGPIWRGGSHDESRILASSYHACLNLAVRSGLRSVAFPSISTGVYGYPIKQASAIAFKTVVDLLRKHGKPQEVRFILFSRHDYEVYLPLVHRFDK
jgi:O-acetyl-ADP-ribose deacetylase (regulator of RNase III)